MARIGFYSGSFDPVTFGHTDVIARAVELVDRLVIGVGLHASKSPLFSAVERVEMLRMETVLIADKSGTEIDIVTFDNLAVDAARAEGATVIFRGLRDGTDFDYEMQMAGMNGAMAPDIQTVFVAASPQVRHIAANLVRQVAKMDGDVSAFVSPEIEACLKKRCAPPEESGNGA